MNGNSDLSREEVLSIDLAMESIEISPCASFNGQPEHRCHQPPVQNSVFCLEHITWAKLHQKYKLLDTIEGVAPNMAPEYYLKRLVKCEQAMNLRLDFRERAIAYSARDVGHDIRIELLQDYADQCVAHLEELFNQPQPIEPVELVEPVEAIKCEFKTTVQRVFKIYRATRKRHEDWLGLAETLIQGDQKRLNDDLEYLLELFPHIPGANQFTQGQAVKLGIFYGMLDRFLQETGSTLYWGIKETKVSGRSRSSIDASPGSLINGLPETSFNGPPGLSVNDHCRYSVKDPEGFLTKDTQQVGSLGSIFHTLKCFGYTQDIQGQHAIYLKPPAESLPPAKVVELHNLVHFIETTPKMIFLGSFYSLKCRHAAWVVTPKSVMFVSIGIDLNKPARGADQMNDIMEVLNNPHQNKLQKALDKCHARSKDDYVQDDRLYFGKAPFSYTFDPNDLRLDVKELLEHHYPPSLEKVIKENHPLFKSRVINDFIIQALVRRIQVLLTLPEKKMTPILKVQTNIQNLLTLNFPIELFDFEFSPRVGIRDINQLNRRSHLIFSSHDRLETVMKKKINLT